MNELKNKNKCDKTNSNLKSLHPGFIWDTEAASRYKTGLKSREVNDRLKKILESNNPKPISIASEIKDILISNAKRCNLKRKKFSQNDKCVSAPWFDSECEIEKGNLRNLGTNLRHNPSDQNTRNELNMQKRNFKKLVKTKKRQYKGNILEKMIYSKNSNQKYFWNMLNKISPNKNFDTGGVSADTFADYFKTLLTSKSPIDMPDNSTEIGPLDYIITMEELE